MSTSMSGMDARYTAVTYLRRGDEVIEDAEERVNAEGAIVLSADDVFVLEGDHDQLARVVCRILGALPAGTVTVDALVTALATQAPISSQEHPATGRAVYAAAAAVLTAEHENALHHDAVEPGCPECLTDYASDLAADGARMLLGEPEHSAEIEANSAGQTYAEVAEVLRRHLPAAPAPESAGGA